MSTPIHRSVPAWNAAVELRDSLTKRYPDSFIQGVMKDQSFSAIMEEPKLALRMENLWRSCNNRTLKFFTIRFDDADVLFHRVDHLRYDVIYFNPDTPSAVWVAWVAPDEAIERSEYITSDSFKYAQPVQHFYAELIDFPSAVEAVKEVFEYSLAEFEKMVKQVVNYIPQYVNHAGAESVKNTTTDNEMALVIQIMRLHVDAKSQLLAEKVFGLNGNLREDTLDFNGYRALREIREAFVHKNASIDNLEWLSTQYRWLQHELS